MNYEIVYRAANNYEANFIKGLLNQYSIDSRLLGGNLSIGVGELPIDVLQVKILVPITQVDKTKKILADYEKNFLLDQGKEEWCCVYCKEENPSSFEVCWNCGNEKNDVHISSTRSISSTSL